MLRLLTTAMELGRPYVMSGQVPAERVSILQKAFAAAAKDPQFIELATKRNLGAQPGHRARGAAILAKAFATPRHIIDRARDILK